MSGIKSETLTRLRRTDSGGSSLGVVLGRAGGTLDTRGGKKWSDTSALRTLLPKRPGVSSVKQLVRRQKINPVEQAAAQQQDPIAAWELRRAPSSPALQALPSPSASSKLAAYSPLGGARWAGPDTPHRGRAPALAAPPTPQGLTTASWPLTPGGETEPGSPARSGNATTQSRPGTAGLSRTQSRPGTANAGRPTAGSRPGTAKQGSSDSFRSRAVELQVKLRCELAKAEEDQSKEESLQGEVTPAQMKVYGEFFEAVIDSNPAFSVALRQVKVAYDACLAKVGSTPLTSLAKRPVVAKAPEVTQDGPLAWNAKLTMLEMENRRLRDVAARLYREERAREEAMLAEAVEAKAAEERANLAAARLRASVAFTLMTRVEPEPDNAEEKEEEAATETASPPHKEGKADQDEVKAVLPPEMTATISGPKQMSISSKGVRMEPWW